MLQALFQRRALRRGIRSEDGFDKVAGAGQCQIREFTLKHALNPPRKYRYGQCARPVAEHLQPGSVAGIAAGPTTNPERRIGSAVTDRGLELGPVGNAALGCLDPVQRQQGLPQPDAGEITAFIKHRDAQRQVFIAGA